MTRPDPSQLWEQYLDSQRAIEVYPYNNGGIAESCQWPRKYPFTKEYFTKCVMHVIDAIEQGKPLTSLTYAGDSYYQTFVKIDTRLGVPTRQIGCKLIIQEGDFVVCDGHNMALNWYAEQGIYPANSFRQKMLDELPEDILWNPMTSSPPDTTGPAAYTMQHPSGPLPTLVFQIDKTEFRCDWPRRTCSREPSPKYFDEDFHVAGCHWFFHEPTQTLLLKSDHVLEYTNDPVILQLVPQSNEVIGEFIQNRLSVSDRLMKSIRRQEDKCMEALSSGEVSLDAAREIVLYVSFQLRRNYQNTLTALRKGELYSYAEKALEICNKLLPAPNYSRLFTFSCCFEDIAKCLEQDGETLKAEPYRAVLTRITYPARE